MGAFRIGKSEHGLYFSIRIFIIILLLAKLLLVSIIESQLYVALFLPAFGWGVD